VQEIDEEIGLSPRDFDEQLIGYLSQTPATFAPNDLFVYAIRSKRSLSEIIERHAQGHRLYRREKGRGVSEKGMIETLQAAGFPTGVAEHSELYTLENAPDAILEFLTAHATDQTLTESVYGALPLYILVEFGQREFENIIRHPALQEHIDATGLELFL
jgi:hypothetical protein